MITALPVNSILVADGDFAPTKAYGAGRPYSIELSGTFGGATVVGGYVTADVVPDFAADVPAVSKTAAGRWTTTRPSSGKPALRVSGATGTTAILVKFVDLPR